MRLIVVSQTYIVASNQGKYVEMKRLYADLQLRMLTPPSVTHIFGRFARDVAPGMSVKELIDIRGFFTGTPMGFVLDPLRFARVLREFCPDWVQIEADPYSAAGVETVFLTRLFRPTAKISFFTWDNLAREPRWPINVVKWTLNRYSLKRAELVMCGNREAESLLRGTKRYTGRTAVLPQLGLEPDAYLKPKNRKLKATLNIPETVPVIGYMGRLVPEKGVMLLLESLHRLRELPWHAIIVGSGPIEKEIGGKWKAVFGNRLHFRSAVPHPEVPDYMLAMDIFVLPSYATPRWKEQFGLVLAQAMMAAVPCIGSSSGAIPEVIGPGGLVFKEKDVGALTKLLERLLNSEAERESLGKAARTFALAHYTNAAVAKAYLEAFHSIGC